MMDYVTLEIITGKVEPPTHCHGKDGNPPLASGTSHGKCNIENGCLSGYGSGHHECVFRATHLSEVLYCECHKNKDFDEKGDSIKHYFSHRKGDIVAHDTLCVYCAEHCEQ